MAIRTAIITTMATRGFCFEKFNKTLGSLPSQIIKKRRPTVMIDPLANKRRNNQPDWNTSQTKKNGKSGIKTINKTINPIMKPIFLLVESP